MRLILALLLLPALAQAVEPGDVVFTELMLAPGSTAEWVELRNVSGAEVALSGCRLETGEQSAELGPFNLDAGRSAVVSQGVGSCVLRNEDGDCLAPSQAFYQGDLLDEHAPGVIRLDCGGEIDAVAYDWSAHRELCLGGALCAVGVLENSATAAGNDDFAGNWCIAPAADYVYTVVAEGEDGIELVGSPGSENSCAAPPCLAGDAIFTELMINPAHSSIGEWIELKVLDNLGCDLHGCEVREGPFPDALHDPLDTEWRRGFIDAPGNELFVASGEYALFGDPETGEIAGVPVSLPDSLVTLSNSPDRYLHLVCGPEVLDSTPYDWNEFVTGCGLAGCSVNLPAAREEAGNDELTNWCLPSTDVLHRVPKDIQLEYSATPGAPGLCEQRAWPAVGEALVTELMIAPLNGDRDSFPEWFELRNVSDRDLDLVGCTLVRDRFGEDGELDPTKVVSTVISADGPDVDLAPDATQLFTKSKCLDGEDPEGGECPGGEIPYGSLSFTTERERFELRCPDGDGGVTVVDSLVYDFERGAVRSGHSIVYDGRDAAGNDLPEAWCEAALDECFQEDDRGRCNYGTPGEAHTCRTGLVELPPSGPGARCEAAGGGSLLWLLALGAVRRRSKRRRT